MGLIIDTSSEILGVEIRRESVNLCDLKRIYPGEEGNTVTRQRTVIPIKSEHIFAYADGEIEVSKEWLRELLAFFAKKENQEYLA